MQNNTDRIVFLDYLRVFAIFLVMLVHCCECYYFDENACFYISSRSNAFWLSLFDSASRASVPLFVMASAYLLFPVNQPTGRFLLRRILRVGIPFLLWACLYHWRYEGAWSKLFFNFSSTTGGHLWFVPMLIGLYLLMPLLSPWAEKVTERELRLWLIVWLFTTTFPFLRQLWGYLYGAPAYGAVPYLYGECPWNSFGSFHYISGFIGYVLLGFYFRRFAPPLSGRRSLALAAPLLIVGYLIVFCGFYFRIPSEHGYPVAGPYSLAVELETSWEFCSSGVLMTVLGYFLILRQFTASNGLYRRIIHPFSEASFGVYLLHMFVLVEVMGWFKPALPTPFALLLGALSVFLLSTALSMIIRRLPFLGRWICG